MRSEWGRGGGEGWAGVIIFSFVFFFFLCFLFRCVCFSISDQLGGWSGAGGEPQSRPSCPFSCYLVMEAWTLGMGGFPLIESGEFS